MKNKIIDIKNEFNKWLSIGDHKKQFQLILVIELLAIALFIFDLYSDVFHYDGRLQRNEYGEGNLEEELNVEFALDGEEYQEEVTTDLLEKPLSEEEANGYIDQAIEEIDRSFPGENISLDQVTKDVNVSDSYANGMVEAEWSFDDSGQVNNSGEITIQENAEPVTASVILTCGTVSREYDFPFQIVMPDEGTAEGMLYYIRQAITEDEEENRIASEDQSSAKSDETSREYTLPGQVQGINLVWSKKLNTRGLLLAVLGVVTGLAIVLGERQEKKDEEKKRLNEMDKDYPMIVSELSLYVSAGISLREAIRRIAAKYERTRAPNHMRPGYELIMICSNDINDGRGEISAYERMGENSGHRSFRKLSMLLTQNLKKGTQGLADALTKEEKESFEERKLRAKIKGEEASTKLLIPMMLLLGIVIVILVIPAFTEMGIS